MRCCRKRGRSAPTHPGVFTILILLLLLSVSTTDFSIQDPNKSFTIIWRAFGVSLIYSPVDVVNGCYRIQIQAPPSGNARIWVNDGKDGEGIDLDTKDRPTGVHDFCSKWLRIHVANDRN